MTAEQLWKIFELNKKTESFSFGVCDTRRREIGSVIELFDIKYAPVENYGYRHGPENGAFGMRVHATRAGFRFGATQPRQFFKTTEDRDAAKAKYLAGARKRAEKLAEKADAE